MLATTSGRRHGRPWLPLKGAGGVAHVVVPPLSSSCWAFCCRPANGCGRARSSIDTMTLDAATALRQTAVALRRAQELTTPKRVLDSISEAQELLGSLVGGKPKHAAAITACQKLLDVCASKTEAREDPAAAGLLWGSSSGRDGDSNVHNDTMRKFDDVHLKICQMFDLLQGHVAATTAAPPPACEDAHVLGSDDAHGSPAMHRQRTHRHHLPHHRQRQLHHRHYHDVDPAFDFSGRHLQHSTDEDEDGGGDGEDDDDDGCGDDLRSESSSGGGSSPADPHRHRSIGNDRARRREPPLPFTHLLQRPALGDVDELVGLDDTKTSLTQMVALPRLLPPAMLVFPRHAPCSALLYGPPGTGKTTLASFLAAHEGMSLICVSPSTVFSKWTGDAEAKLSQLFQLQAHSTPCVLFFDEVDALLTSALAGQQLGGGSDGGDAGAARIRAEFLVQMSAFKDRRKHARATSGGRGGGGGEGSGAGGSDCRSPEEGNIVIAATNRIDQLDRAVLRRFDRKIHVGTPSAAARHHLLQLHVGSIAHTLTAGDVAELIAKTDQWSAADLLELISEAAMRPVKELLQRVAQPSATTTGAGASRVTSAVQAPEQPAAAAHHGAGHDPAAAGPLHLWPSRADSPAACATFVKSEQPRSGNSGNGGGSTAAAGDVRPVSALDFHAAMRTLGNNAEWAPASAPSAAASSSGGTGNPNCTDSTNHESSGSPHGAIKDDD